LLRSNNQSAEGLLWLAKNPMKLFFSSSASQACLHSLQPHQSTPLEHRINLRLLASFFRFQSPSNLPILFDSHLFIYLFIYLLHSQSFSDKGGSNFLPFLTVLRFTFPQKTRCIHNVIFPSSSRAAFSSFRIFWFPAYDSVW
jgi:hypothetical protein